MESFLTQKIFLFLLLIPNIISVEEEIFLQYPEIPEKAEGWDKGEYCFSTQIQSPIDIPSIKNDSVLIDDGTHAYFKSFSYNNISNAKLLFRHGHSWTTENLTDLDPGYIEIYLNETLYQYKLYAFHFHLYSEHRFENKQYPMELHLVHKSLNFSSDDNPNRNLVIGVLFDYKDDIENKFLNDVHLAEEKEITNASILDLISPNDTFYYYKGSLTTPDCNENVNWIVFKDVKSFSFEQFDRFQNWIEKTNPKYYGTGYGNARGPKRLSGRMIYLENYKEEVKSVGTNNFSMIPRTTLLMLLMFLF